MTLADPVNTYTVSITRGVPNLESNQITISTTGAYVNLLFGSGVNASNSVASLLGFNAIDYTGFATYNSPNSAGQVLFPDYPIYDYLGPTEYVTNDMSKSVSAAGIKETLVFAQVQFIEGSWKYINNFNENTQKTQWETFLLYAIRQLKFEFTESVYESVNTIYPVTLESTASGSDGGSYKLQLMNKDGLFRFYETGTMKFRVVPNVS